MGAGPHAGRQRETGIFQDCASTSVPYIFAGLQIAVTAGWSAVVGAEMIQSNEGVGWMIVRGMNTGNTVQIMVGMVTIGIVGFVLANLTSALEKEVVRMERAKGPMSTSTGAPVLECRDVGRSFDSCEKDGERNEVLHGVNFEVKENEFLVLFGAGQCGKTTLLNILAGLDMPTQGAVYTRGQKVTGPAPERGVVYQKTSLFPLVDRGGQRGFRPQSA